MFLAEAVAAVVAVVSFLSSLFQMLDLGHKFVGVAVARFFGKFSLTALSPTKIALLAAPLFISFVSCSQQAGVQLHEVGTAPPASSPRTDSANGQNGWRVTVEGPEGYPFYFEAGHPRQARPDAGSCP